MRFTPSSRGLRCVFWIGQYAPVVCILRPGRVSAAGSSCTHFTGSWEQQLRCTVDFWRNSGTNTGNHDRMASVGAFLQGGRIFANNPPKIVPGFCKNADYLPEIRTKHCAKLFLHISYQCGLCKYSYSYVSYKIQNQNYESQCRRIPCYPPALALFCIHRKSLESYCGNTNADML